MRKVIARSVFAVFGLLALLPAAQASAENVHVITQTIKSFDGYKFGEPFAVAVDSSTGPSAGDFYVDDRSNRRIVKFNEAGEFLLMWGKQVNEGSGDPNVCTNAGEPTDICKGGAYAEYNSSLGFSNAWVPAVDSSAGPSSGDLYLVNDNVLRKYDQGGHLVTTFGGSPYPGGVSVPGEFSGYYSTVVDSSGHPWVANAHEATEFSESGTIIKTVDLHIFPSVGFAMDGVTGNFYGTTWNPYGTPNGAEGTIEAVGPTGTYLGRVSQSTSHNRYGGVAFDESTRELFGSWINYDNYPNSTSGINAYQFNGSGEVIEPDSSTCALSGTTGCPPSEVFGNQGELNTQNQGPQELAINAVTHAIYVADPSNHAIAIFKRIDVPKISVGAITSLTRTSATFNGHVDPDGAGEVTSCEFEYGTTKSYGTSVPCAPPTTSTATDVSAALPPETLKAATTYHYRLAVANGNGPRTSADQTFTTEVATAGVTTEEVENLGRITATAKGTYTGDGTPTHYYFEYGPTTEYGQSTSPVDDGEKTGPQVVTQQLEGLFAYYPYHYRIVVENRFGKTYGQDLTFHTEEPDAPSVEETFPSDVGSSRAVLNAKLDLGEGLTVYRFEYGLSTSYGSRSLVAGPIDPSGSDRTASTEVTELTPGATYHFRVVASNLAGTVNGPDEEFTTPSAPLIGQESVEGVGQTTATLVTQINPSLSPTTVHYEYGTTGAYGSSTAESASLGADNAIHSSDATIAGLAPGTLYHFRAVARNGIGTTAGPDQTFKTVAAPVETPPHEEPKPKPCKKGFVKKHGKCVRKPRHRKHHKSHHHRGGKRG